MGRKKKFLQTFQKLTVVVVAVAVCNFGRSSQDISREITIEARSQHCPVIRPGPALGCNFCWNTIDAHGRILRRKTKYRK